MCPTWCHISASLKEASSGPKGRKILWNDALDNFFKELKRMVSAEILISYPYWKLPFTFHNDASDKQLGAVISNNNKPIAFFSRRSIKPQSNYTTTEKELSAIVGCFKKFQVIIFGYEINVFPYYKNLVYAITLSESQRVMRWQLIE